ncbi:MAG: hypothetical protein IT546_15335 [Caulobacteraceae bacterium]|nr:hypothetical protein [Caulobacteraceae bacterium]
MTSTPVKTALIAALAASTAGPAFAQYQPTEQYQRDLDRYERQRGDYERARDRYDDRRDSYEDARADYDRRRSDYERARADYDRRYGYGSYARRYGPAPTWDSRGWGTSDPYSRGDYRDRDYAYDDPCDDRRQGNTVAGGLIGAIAGAALGSNVAASGARTEGAVLGALVGGGIGAAIGNSSAKCDDNGHYWTYNDTIPYREGSYYRNRNSGRYGYSYYNRQRCRLAAAPSDWGGRTEYRYVRVCPDRQGRYRITS